MDKQVSHEIHRGIADSQLELAFGAQWINLKRGRKEVLDDFIEAAVREGITVAEYQRRISPAPLQRYANCLLVKPCKA